MSEAARILVVDDDPTNRMVLGRSLVRAGYEVLTANDGPEAVAAAREQDPDLILLDVMMPGQTGWEVCAVLKADTQTAGIPVIFVTSAAETGQILQGFSVGGCDYVTRPFTVDEVIARVSVHIRLRQAEEELREKNRQLQDLADQLAGINVELAESSRRDPLTKLLNRASWAESMATEHLRYTRYGCPYSVIMVDLDHFKAFNDSRGHQAGDECLRQVARALESACRQGDRVGRYGGEEFVILTPETPIEAAIGLAERIRKNVWSLAIAHPASPTANRVTASLGAAASSPGDWEEVVKRADEALYVAKRAGRNMVYGDVRTLPVSAQNRVRIPMVPADTCPGAQPHDAISVLVVDDEPANRTLCRACLARAGYRVFEAEDGQAALAAVRQHRPDVILMDVMMPQVDGLECTRRLKDDPDTRDIPIIIVSALAGGRDIAAGLEAGADEYLTKPIRTTELTLRVKTMAALYRERADLLRSYEVRGEHVRVLTRLVEFCRELGASQKLDDVLDHTIAAVAEVVRARRIAIMLPDACGRRLRIRRSLGIEDELAQAVEVVVGESIAGRVFASGQPAVLNAATHMAGAAPSRDAEFFIGFPLLSAPLMMGGEVVGVLNVGDRVGKQPFEPHEIEFVEMIGKVAATAMHDIAMRQAHEQACDSIMVALAKLAECRDDNTGRHLDRVTRYCVVLAEYLREQPRFRTEIDDNFLFDLQRAVPLHDIGKVAIPDGILLYPGKLSKDQMDIMRTHTVIGANAIRALLERTPNVTFLRMAADIANYHHERYDGTGYPERLSGERIPLSARIVAVADVYDALTTERVYKKAFSHERSRAILLEGSGSQFDAAVIEAFVARAEEFARLAIELADESGQPSEGALELASAVP